MPLEGAAEIAAPHCRNQHCPASRVRAGAHRVPNVARGPRDELGECLARDDRQDGPKSGHNHEFLHAVLFACFEAGSASANEIAQLKDLFPIVFENSLMSITTK
jgi:hypothetical protein